MRKCTIEECQVEQCAPNNPYLCVRKTNGIIDAANSSCYASIPQNLPSDCDFCDMSQCGINPLDNCIIQCKTNSGQFCPNGISCNALPLSNCSTINGELHCCCDAFTPRPAPGPRPVNFCAPGWFPEDKRLYNPNCKKCNSCDPKLISPRCGPFSLIAVKAGAWYDDSEAYLETPEGGRINVMINDICSYSGICIHDPISVQLLNIKDPRGFDFNKEYIVKQNGHEDRCSAHNFSPEQCQGKVKLLVGKDTICK